MRRRALAVVTLVTAVAAVASPAAAASGASGGGRGTLDGTTAFSQFGFGVKFGPGGSASGHFTCLMAGSSAFPGFEPLMKVSGTVSGGAADPTAGTATFTGSGTLNLGPTGRMDALFLVDVREGGAGVGKLRLSVLVPLFPLPEETVLSGEISVR
jgi:hypothetical protein